MAISELFEQPVIILTGLGHPTTVSSSMEAYMFLADWPDCKRDACHRFIMETCLASIRSDEISVWLARSSLLGATRMTFMPQPCWKSPASKRQARETGLQ